MLYLLLEKGLQVMTAGCKVPLGRPELLALVESMRTVTKAVKTRLTIVKGLICQDQFDMTLADWAFSYVQVAKP